MHVLPLSAMVAHPPQAPALPKGGVTEGNCGDQPERSLMSLLALKNTVLREEEATTEKGWLLNSNCQELRLSNLFQSRKPPVEQEDSFPSQGRCDW